MFWRCIMLCMLLAYAPAHAIDRAAIKPLKTIRIAADEWCPYNCKPDDENPGFMIEIARAVFAEKGYRIEYHIMPWEQAIERTRAGEFDAIVGASKQDAPDFIYPNIEQGWMQTQFFTAKNSKWRYLGRDSLSQIVIGAAAGYAYGNAVDVYIKRHAADTSRLILTSGDNVLPTNVKLLLSGKIGALLEDAHVMAYYLAQNNLEGKIKEAGRLPISDQNNVYIAFSPKKPASKRHIATLEEGTNELRASGKLDPILKRYNIQDWRRK